jgi:hypothetical protein
MQTSVCTDATTSESPLATTRREAKKQLSEQKLTLAYLLTTCDETRFAVFGTTFHENYTDSKSLECFLSTVHLGGYAERDHGWYQVVFDLSEKFKNRSEGNWKKVQALFSLILQPGFRENPTIREQMEQSLFDPHTFFGWMMKRGLKIMESVKFWFRDLIRTKQVRTGCKRKREGHAPAGKALEAFWSDSELEETLTYAEQLDLLGPAELGQLSRLSLRTLGS